MLAGRASAVTVQMRFTFYTVLFATIFFSEVFAETVELTPQEAVDRALKYNLSLKFQRLAPTLSVENERAAHGEFDPTIDFNGRFDFSPGRLQIEIQPSIQPSYDLYRYRRYRRYRRRSRSVYRSSRISRRLARQRAIKIRRYLLRKGILRSSLRIKIMSTPPKPKRGRKRSKYLIFRLIARQPAFP